jgi:CheY-like chemotaxis protein
MNDNDHIEHADQKLDGLRTLIVDDQAESRVLMRAMLGIMGIRSVLEAGDGRP